MTEPNDKRSPRGGGAIIALLALGGVIGGGFMGQPSAGLLAGLGLGILISIYLWVSDRRR